MKLKLSSVVMALLLMGCSATSKTKGLNMILDKNNTSNANLNMGVINFSVK